MDIYAITGAEFRTSTRRARFDVIALTFHLHVPSSSLPILVIMPSNDPNESQPLLPLHAPSTPTASSSRRRHGSGLQARRYMPFSSDEEQRNRLAAEYGDGSDSEEDEDEDEEQRIGKRLDKGKGRALPEDEELKPTDDSPPPADTPPEPREITIIFSNAPHPNLSLMLSHSTSIAQLKALIRSHVSELQERGLRLIHSGRLLSDGVRLVPWVETMEIRVKRQAEGGLGLEDVVRGVREIGEGGGGKKGKEERKVYVHCIVGGKEEPQRQQETVEAAAMPRRRGFDVLLDTGFSREDVAQMRRQFYESRGEEVPDDMDTGDINDEHARALEEQWIEGDMTAETAATSTEGLYTAILHGLLFGFLFPLLSWFFLREGPLPNFFDADAEAIAEFRRRAESGHAEGASNAEEDGSGPTGEAGTIAPATAAEEVVAAQVNEMRQISARVAANFSVGGLSVPTHVFGQRMKMGIVIGTLLNFAFGALRMLN
ncbi:hypothetical protein I350_06838 [Cryptococcus amylolentus CBS 6273]|uniref:Ubiquitin-like domain-containing protein n=1 Tax=Cryptococcus amylolentus CBS 6273 TaxID=1296118 RepID=A0A1E3JJU8_9TREE|nr:hypothetical protein I350_06838 [Cryptococcus amylolentus CBS 6273]